jgi:hypothetical protein
MQRDLLNLDNFERFDAYQRSRDLEAPSAGG